MITISVEFGSGDYDAARDVVNELIRHLTYAGDIASVSATPDFVRMRFTTHRKSVEDESSALPVAEKAPEGRQFRYSDLGEF